MIEIADIGDIIDIVILLDIIDILGFYELVIACVHAFRACKSPLQLVRMHLELVIII